MKIKGELRKYCPRCKSHTIHAISTYKAGKRRSMAQGERRMKRKTKGYGSFPKNIQKRFAKTTKKTVLKYKCKECEHTFQTKGMRLKKLEVLRV
jgi:large subunit ribosomal protein L44e